MVLNDFLEPIEFLAGEPPASIQANRIELELGLAVIMLDMNVRRFVPVARVREEAEWSLAKDGRHAGHSSRSAMARQ
jgi:hypothetical protein